MSESVCLPFVVTDIADPGSQAFILELETGTLEGFAVRKGRHIVAYLNRCPHMGVCLNWGENGFLNYDETLIQCSMHGALFTIEEGRCLWGPCRGEVLDRLVLETNAIGQIIVGLKDDGAMQG